MNPGLKISTVAVGTDGSETAGRALEAAVELAERFGARLVVLSAFDGHSRKEAAPRLSGGVPADPGWASNAAEQTERILAVAEESATERGIECSSAMAEGDAGDVLVRLAEKHGADVLVVGSKGMERRVLGSVPNTVSHKAACSVFVVKTA
jgi:nucleotide-binding universal stress UspA family protein